MNPRPPQHVIVWGLLFLAPLLMGAICSVGPDATDEARRVVVRALLDEIVEDYLIVTPFATFTPTATPEPTFTPTPTPTPVGGGGGEVGPAGSGEDGDPAGGADPDDGDVEASPEATSTSAPQVTATGTATALPTVSPTATTPPTVTPSATSPPTATPQPTSTATSEPDGGTPVDPTSTFTPTPVPPTSTPTPTNTPVPPAPPVVSFSPVAYEVLESGGSVTVTVQLDKAGSSNIAVDNATGNLSAFAPNDYAPKAGTLLFTPGQTGKIINVSVVDDSVDDPDSETFQLTLSNPVNADLGDSVAAVGIQDNDPLPVIQFASSEFYVQESDAPTLTVVLDRPSGKNVSFSYASVAGGSATANVDYNPLISARTLSPDIDGIGPSQAILTWDAFIDDTFIEPEETVIIELSGVNNATLGSVYTTTLYILDDDN